jgi:hypothetical protein
VNEDWGKKKDKHGTEQNLHLQGYYSIIEAAKLIMSTVWITAVVFSLAKEVLRSRRGL